MQHAPQIHVETAEDLLAAIDQRGVDTQTMEDVGELHGNVAAAFDHDRLRELLEIESLVGIDAMFVAGQRWMSCRPATGCDQDLVGGDGAVIAQEMYHVRVDDHGA